MSAWPVDSRLRSKRHGAPRSWLDSAPACPSCGCRYYVGGACWDGSYCEACASWAGPGLGRFERLRVVPSQGPAMIVAMDEARARKLAGHLAVERDCSVLVVLAPVGGLRRVLFTVPRPAAVKGGRR